MRVRPRSISWGWRCSSHPNQASKVLWRIAWSCGILHGGTMGEFGQKTGDFIAHVRKVYDHDNGPVLKQKLTEIAAFGPFLAIVLLVIVRSVNICTWLRLLCI